MKTVMCYDCGKEIEVFESRFVTIPKYRCENCLKRK